MTESLTLRRPDDWHLHLRDGAMLAAVAPWSAKFFSRAIVMPNLPEPVTRVEDALAYRQRILASLPSGTTFDPRMALYLTDATTPENVLAAHACEHVIGYKLYPAGATTHSDAGVTDLNRLEPAIAAMAECGLPLLVHGEVTDEDVDIFDREARFAEQVLEPMCDRHPGLRIVVEHVSSRAGVAFVSSRPSNVAATITPQHLLLNRNAMLAGGLRPHNYCLPVLKRERDRLALIEAATSGTEKFFLGTDSAPHLRRQKESACGCAGTFNVVAALAVYAEVFAAANALSHLERFASLNGPAFYGLAPNEDTVTLVQKPWRVPASIEVGEESLVPWLAGEQLGWQVLDS